MTHITSPIDVLIRARSEEAEDIFSILLEAPDGAALPTAAPGAHVDVEIAPGCVRQYSLCHDLNERGAYRLAILRDPASRGGSQAAFSTFKPGKPLKISAPRNTFPLTDAPGPAFLFAGGIGVTPLLSMAYSLSRTERPFELHYCTRSHARTAFRDSICASPFAGHVIFHHDDAPSGAFDAARDVPVYQGSGEVYVCGPSGFIDRVREAALAKGWPQDAVHLERFQNEVSTAGAAFTVIAERSGVVVEVMDGETIADKLLAAGIDVPLSCEEGLCGACLTPILEGIAEHRDAFQTPAEQAANSHMTVCCSRARSAVLRLDI